MRIPIKIRNKVDHFKEVLMLRLNRLRANVLKIIYKGKTR